jgi:catecholate siderophore receptor
MHSMRAGLVYKPREAGSVYASYGTSLNPSLEGLSYSVANTQIEPEKTYTFEVGSKWELAGGKLLLNGAAFRVEKTNARTAGLLPDDPPQILDGRQRASGIELGATGSITRAWKVYGAYTLLDARIVESNSAAEVGRRIQNAPRNSANIWTSYRVGKFDVGGGIRAVGRRYSDTANLRYVDSYWSADAMGSYALNSRVDLRLNLYNLNNAYYFERLSGGHVVPGAARSIVLSTGVRF